MKELNNVISLEKINGNYVSTYLSSQADGSNSIYVEIEPEEGSTNPRLQIYLNNTLKSTANLIDGIYNEVEIDSSLFVANGIVKFRYIDSSYTSNDFTITFPADLNGNLMVKKSTDYTFLAQYPVGASNDISDKTINTIDSITTEYPEITSGIVANIIGKIKKFLSDLKDKKSDVGHTHDNRYYTESEIDNKLSDKQDKITGAATTITSNNLTANRILQSDSNGKVAASGYEFDINTNNTSDTWLLVMRNEKIQHRLTTDLSVKYATSAGKLDSLGNQTPETGRTANRGGVYTYNKTYNQGTIPTNYMSVIGFGRGASGCAEIACEWTSGQGMWIRALRDYQDNWYDWVQVITAKGGTMSEWLNFNSNKGVRIASRAQLTDMGTSSFIACANNGVFVRRYDNNNTAQQINASAFNTASSKLIKENIKPISEEEAKKLLQLNVVNYDYKYLIEGKNKTGMIAEEVFDILPNYVHVPENYNEDETKEKLENGEFVDTMSLDYSDFVPPLIKLVQIQQKRIDDLRNELEELKALIKGGK